MTSIIPLYGEDTQPTPLFEYTRAAALPGQSPEAKRLQRTITEIKESGKAFDLTGLGGDDEGPIQYVIGKVDWHKIWVDKSLYTWTENDLLFFGGTTAGTRAFDAFCRMMLKHAVRDGAVIAEYNAEPLMLLDRVNPNDDGQPFMLLSGMDIYESANPDSLDTPVKLLSWVRPNCSDYDVRAIGIVTKKHRSPMSNEELVRQVYLAGKDRANGDFSADSAEYPITAQEFADFAGITLEYAQDILQVYANEAVLQYLCERRLDIGKAIVVIHSTAAEKWQRFFDEVLRFAISQNTSRSELMDFIKQMKDRDGIPISRLRKHALRGLGGSYTRLTNTLSEDGNILKELLPAEEFQELESMAQRIKVLMDAADRTARSLPQSVVKPGEIAMPQLKKSS